MSKNLGRAVLGMVIFKGAFLGGLYLYNKLNQKDKDDLSDSCKKEANEIKNKLNEVVAEAKTEVTALNKKVVDNAQKILGVMKEDKVVVKKATKPAVKKTVAKKTVNKEVAEVEKKTATKTPRKTTVKPVAKKATRKVTTKPVPKDKAE